MRPGADTQQVVEDEHLPVGGKPRANADHRHLDAGHQGVGNRRGHRFEDDREATRRLQRECVAGDLRRRLRGPPLRLEASQRTRRLRRQANVPHHRDSRAGDRPRPLHRRPAALQLHGIAARLFDEPLRVLDCVLVRALIGAERHIADQERRAQTPPNGGRHGHHLVHPDRRRGLVPEHHHRGGVAHQHDVHARFLGHLRGGEVVGGDHHDRLALVLHLGEPR